jgi:hypothetical protein
LLENKEEKERHPFHAPPIEIEPIWPDLITHFNRERLGPRQKQQDALCHRTQLQTSTPAKVIMKSGERFSNVRLLSGACERGALCVFVRERTSKSAAHWSIEA